MPDIILPEAAQAFLLEIVEKNQPAERKKVEEIILLESHTVSKVVEERQRQFEKFGDEPIATNGGFLRIAMEELGEIARAVNQRKPQDEIDKEIIQLAAVCLAHYEKKLHDGAEL